MKKKKKTFKVLDLWDAATLNQDLWNERISYQFKNDAKEYTRALKAGFNFMDKRFSRATVMKSDYDKYLDLYKDVKNVKISNTNWDKAKDLTTRWRNFIEEGGFDFGEAVRHSTVQTAGNRTYVNLNSDYYTRTGNVRKRKRKAKTSYERIANHNEEVAAWKLYKMLRDNGEDVDLKTGIADYISPYMLSLVSIYENTAGHRLNIIENIEEVETGTTDYRAVSFRFSPRVLKVLQKIVPKIDAEEGTQIKLYTNKYENFRKLPKKRD